MDDESRSSYSDIKIREKMYRRIKAFTNDELQMTWDALKSGYDPGTMYDTGITMEQWTQAIFDEMDERDMSHA